jgi:uncharacterized MAPEG superfamily protein
VAVAANGDGTAGACGDLNSFEAFPLFAAAVLAGVQTGVASLLIAKLSIGFVCARILYGAAYLANVAPLRSLIWFVGFGFACAILVAAVRAF